MKWQPTLVFLPGQSRGQRHLAGYSPWGHRELDTTERLTLFCHLTFPGQGVAGVGHVLSHPLSHLTKQRRHKPHPYITLLWKEH